MNKIIACGVPRTGSTLIWKILKDCLPGYEIVKGHPASWHPFPCDHIFSSIRHPYDNAASCFRTRIVGDKGDGSQETVEGTKQGLIAELKMLTNNYHQLKVLRDTLPEIVTVFRYEEFFNNFDIIFDTIEKSLNVKIPLIKQERINKDYSFESNRKRLLKLNPGDKRIERMGVSHVAVGYPGSWKAIIPFWGYDVLKKWAEPLCKEWGYENQ
jgi:hypothetical protein